MGSRRRRKHAGAFAVMFPVIGILYLLAPTVGQAWNAKVHAGGMSQLAPQSAAVPAHLTNADRKTFQSLAATPVLADSPPIILTYHNITPHPTGYSISPQQFADDMAMLKLAGFHTVGANDLVSYLNGGTLAPRSVMVTFDDGIGGVWTYADPILRADGMQAVAFVITGFLGTHAPYYMTWPEVVSLSESGRWDVESHTHLGHQNVVVDANGSQGPFLNSLAWLPERSRSETPTEYAARIRSDLETSKSDLEAHGLPSPALFAYPFSANGGTVASQLLSNEVSDLFKGSMLEGMVSSLFGVAVLDDYKARPNGYLDLAKRELNRIDAYAGETVADLYASLVAVVQIPVTANPLSDVGAWSEVAGNDGKASFGASTVSVDSPIGETSIWSYAPTRTVDWREYSVSADVSGLAIGQSHVTAVAEILSSTPNEVQAVVTGDSVTVSRGAFFVISKELRPSGSHSLTMTVSGPSVTVTADGQRVAVVPVAGAAGRSACGGFGLGSVRAGAGAAPVFSNVRVKDLGK